MKALNLILLCLIFISTGACDSNEGQNKATRAGGSGGGSAGKPTTGDGEPGSPVTEDLTQCKNKEDFFDLEKFIDRNLKDPKITRIKMAFTGLSLEPAEDSQISEDKFTQLHLQLLNNKEKKKYQDLFFVTSLKSFFNSKNNTAVNTFPFNQIKQDSCKSKTLTAKANGANIQFTTFVRPKISGKALYLASTADKQTSTYLDKFSLIVFYPHKTENKILIEGIYDFKGHIAKVHFVLEAFGESSPSYAYLDHQFWETLTKLNIDVADGVDSTNKDAGFEGIQIKLKAFEAFSMMDTIKQFIKKKKLKLKL